MRGLRSRRPDRVPYYSPLDLPGISAWYDMQRFQPGGVADGAAVTTWNNLVGGSTMPAFSQTTTASKPLYRASGINGRPALDFDGTDDYMTAVPAADFPPDGTDQPCSMALVFQQEVSGSDIPFCWGSGGVASYFEFVIDPTTNNDYHYNKQDSAGVRDAAALVGGPTPDLNPHVVVLSHNGTASSAYMDGIKYSSGVSTNVGVMQIDLLCIGRRMGGGASAFSYNGRIGELIVSTQVWAFWEAWGISRYLSKKWGIPTQ